MARHLDSPASSVPQSAHTVHIRLFGGCQVEVAGNVRALPYDKVRALLAWLVLEARRPVSRALVADMLWPEAEADDARANLRHALHSLKRVLGEGAGSIVADRKSLCFQPRHVCIDVLDFFSDSLSPAWRLALYRGEFLQDLVLDACPVWQQWCDGWRQRLHGDVLAQLATLSREQRASAQWQAAQATLDRWLELCPWDEEAYRQLIRLALETGNVAAARVWYERCEQALRSELDTRPAAETRALLRQVPDGPVLPVGNQPLVAVHLELPVSQDADLEEEAEQLVARRRLAHQALLQEGAGYCVELPDGGLLAYFGYPSTSEYAARRAAVSAQKIGRLLSAEGARFSLGLHAGLAPVGARPDGAGVIAAGAGRLARQADEGSIVVSEAVRDRLADTLPLDPGPPGLFRLVDAGRPARVLHGRHPQLRHIDRLWQQALEGQRPTGVLVSAEPGCGKSALVEAVGSRLAEQGERVIMLHCAEQGRHQAFRLLLDWVAEQAGVMPGSRDVVQACLARWLEAGDGGALAAVLARFFVTEQDESRLAVDDHAGKLAEALACALGKGPVCLIVEDLHWCDDASLETLALLQKQARGPLMLLATSRPTLPKALVLPVMTLPSLPDSAMQAVVRQAAGEAWLDDGLRRRIVQRAAGVPLYAQEMTRLWLSGGVSTDDAGEPALSPSGRILDMVAARLANMGEARRVAQRIAVAGNPADPDWLAALLDDSALPLPACLAQLRDAGILADAEGEPVRFSHALVFDAVYATLGQSERRALHARLADWLVQQRPRLADTAPLMVAQHLSRAADPRAAALRLRAARQTAANAAWQDLLGQLPALLDDIGRVPDIAARRTLERQAALLEGGASIALRGDGDARGAAAYQRARALCSDTDQQDLFMATWGCWQVADATEPTDIVQGHARELLRLAARRHVPAERRQACFATGISRMFAGNLSAAQHWFQRAMRETGGEDVVFGPDSYCGCQALVGYMQCLRGQPDAAVRNLRAAAQRAGRLGHAWSSAYVQDVSMLVYLWRGEPRQVLHLAAALRREAGSAGMRFWLRFGLGLEGVARTMLGEAEGLAALDETLALIDEAHPALRIIFHPLRAEALWHLGQDQACLVTIEESLAILARYRSTFGLPELWRRRAASLARLGQRDSARAAADEARRLALSAGAGMTLARLASLPPLD